METLTHTTGHTPPKTGQYGFERILGALQEVRSVLRRQELAEDFVIIGGANLVLRGIKPDTRDIDLLASRDTVRALMAHPKTVVKDPPTRAIEQGATNKSAILHSGWSREIPVSVTDTMGEGWFNMDYATRYRSDEFVDTMLGNRLIQLEDVWESKKAILRPGDRIDLELIANADKRFDISTVPQLGLFSQIQWAS